MAINPGNSNAFHLGRFLVDLKRRIDRYAKLVVFQTCRNVGMRLRIYVRIDSQGHRSLHAHSHGHIVQLVKLGL